MRPDRWDGYWFGRGPLLRLAAFRIVLLATALHALYKYDGAVSWFTGLDGGPGITRTWRPIFAFELLGIGPMGAGEAGAVRAALLAAIALGMLGLFTRTACAVAAVLTFLWIGTAYSFRVPHHDSVALVFGLAALPFAPVGARLSLDALLARRRRGGRRPPVESELALLPLRVTQVTVALGYFFAAATKLARSGLEWANGYTLQGFMISFRSPWTDAVTESVPLCRAMSVATLVVQGAFPLVLFLPVTRWFFLPAAVAFHLVAWQTMSTGTFATLWFTLACFVPLERVPAAFARTVGEGHLLRRLAFGAVWAGGAALVAAIWVRSVPAVTLLALVPVAAYAVRCVAGRGGLAPGGRTADAR